MSAAQGFGDRLAQERREKAARERRDIAQRDVARAVGVSAASLSRYEAGDTLPDDEVIERLAAYYGVSRSWLRYGEGSRTPGTEGMADTATGAPRMEQRPAQRPHVPQRKQSGRGGK